MNWSDAFQIIIAALTSIGVGGGIVFALSSWLAKVWAARILEKERHNLEILKETTLKFHGDKVLAYREMTDTVARILATLDAHQFGRLDRDAATAYFDRFNEERIRLYGHMVMLAPQSVMDAQDQLIDHILYICVGKADYQWEEIRTKALGLLNAVRADIGIGKEPIRYNGAL